MLIQKTEFATHLRLPASEKAKNSIIADFLRILESVIEVASFVPESDQTKTENTLILELKANVYANCNELNKEPR